MGISKLTIGLGITLAVSITLTGNIAHAEARLRPLYQNSKLSPVNLSQQITNLSFFGDPSDSTIDPSRKPKTKPAVVSADLQYFGGAMLANVNIVAVMWGASVDAQTTSSIGGFYASVVDSAYLDWLSEYNTNITAQNGDQGTNQSIGRGTYSGLVQINPNISSTSIDDTQIQSEIDAQITQGVLPAPTANTLYMIHFPLNASITQTDSSGSTAASCVQFCAYHSAFLSKKNGQLNYGILPDLNSDGCNTGGCGNADAFGNLTSGASHEMTEAITDSGVGLVAGNSGAYPMGWYDNAKGEIGDICAGTDGTLQGKDGKSYNVQSEWSNKQASCVTGL